MRTYPVEVSRHRSPRWDGWRASVEGLPGADTSAPTLSELRRAVAEVIVRVAGLPSSAVDDVAARIRFRVR
ncbi:MAG: hypothetical protein IRZ08_14375 [Frankia sp.]|nr:hypothetical protein [Frankia sp.]